MAGTLAPMLPAARIRGRLVPAVIALVVLAGCGSAASRSGSSAGHGTVDSELVQRLSSGVTDGGAFTHLQALQGIADQHGGNRASPSPGFDASVDYVVGVLRKAGYDVCMPTYQASDDDGDADGHGGSSGNSDRGGSGSEEEGAVGSAGYLKSLSKADRQKILLYLNVDMVASPNAGYFVQGGKGDERSATGPEGSATIAQVLADQLKQAGVTAETRVVLSHYLRAIAGTLAHFATSDDFRAR